MTKRWFGLNKTRSAITGIKSLFKNTDGEETTEPAEMLEISRAHHAKLQSEPLMRETRKTAIDKFLGGVTRKLSEKDSRTLAKDVSYT